MRRARMLVAIGSWWLTGCTAIVDRVEYHECERASYAEEFKKGSTMETLYERCWLLDNTDNALSNVFVYEDALFIRTTEATGGQQLEQWDEENQAPMVFHRLDGDFLAVTRVEASHKIDASQCLEPGNVAGMVVRQGEGWATLLTGPFRLDEPELFDCADEPELLPPPPTRVELKTRDGSWGASYIEEGGGDGIGVDGAADIAACRVQSSVSYWYRDPAAELWRQIGDTTDFVHTVASGPVDVGLTAAGLQPTFHVAGQFEWAIIQDVVGGACSDTLQELPLPGGE